MITPSSVSQSSEQFVGGETFLKNHKAMGGEVFKSRNSLEWFCRCHTELLFASGQFIPRRGSAGTLYGPLFTKVALEILRSLHSTAMQQMTVLESQDSP